MSFPPTPRARCLRPSPICNKGSYGRRRRAASFSGDICPLAVFARCFGSRWLVWPPRPLACGPLFSRVLFLLFLETKTVLPVSVVCDSVFSDMLKLLGRRIVGYVLCAVTQRLLSQFSLRLAATPLLILMRLSRLLGSFRGSPRARKEIPSSSPPSARRRCYAATILQRPLLVPCTSRPMAGGQRKCISNLLNAPEISAPYVN